MSNSDIPRCNHCYKDIIDHSIDIIYLVEVTLKGRFIHLDINAAYIEASGMSKETILGCYVDEFENKAYRAILLDKYTSCLNAGKRIDYINDYPFPEGTKTLHSVLTPMFNEKGQIYQIVGIARDITEQRKIESELVSREREFRSLAENTPDNIARWDCEGRYLYVNPVHERTLGKTAFEVVGTFLPDSHDVVKTAIAQVVSTGEQITVSQTVTTKDGKIEYHEVRMVPECDADGRIMSVLGIGRDITEKKMQEVRLHKTKAKLSAVISSNPDLLWVKDAEGVYLMCNPAFGNFFGAECGEILGKTDYDFISKEQADFFRLKDREAVEAGGMRINEEEIIFAHNGQRALLETRKVPVYNGDEFMGVLGIGRDITEKRASEKMIYMLLHAINTSSESIFLIKTERPDFKYVNDTAAKILGYTKEELTNGMGVFDIDPDFNDINLWIEHVEMLESYNGRTFETRHCSKDGRIYPVEIRSTFFTYENERFIFSTSKDITERKQMELEIAKQKDFQNTLLHSIVEAGLGVHVIEDGKYIYTNDIEKAKQYGYDETIADIKPSFLDTIHPDDRAKARDIYTRRLRGEDVPSTYELGVIQKDGSRREHSVSVIMIPNTDPVRTIVVTQDISDKKAAEETIEHMAHHDALTGLPNRTLAKDKAEYIMSMAKHSGAKAALLFIDLDGFKSVNDTLGHSIGDLLLKNVASRLKECIRESDMISRQGGDEFLIIISEIRKNNVIALIAEKILRELEKAFEINSNLLSISGSIGIALYPDHGETFELLLQSADTAMYKAKELGKNGYRLYTKQMNNTMLAQFELQNDLKNALENNEFILFYQPQINLSTNEIIGVEALIRWNHPDKGMIPPMSFIPLAESSGLIVQIGQWVIEEACRQAMLWYKKGVSLTVAVNISAIQFKRGNLESIVNTALNETKLPPCLLELELTESIMMHHIEHTIHTVQSLKALGIQISIDDFGTGYSSLSYLKRFTVDKLKIDQSFVRDILQDQEDAVIVQMIIQMAKTLNLKTIAEGVENQEVLTILKNFGCDEVQGYYFAKPMHTAEFERYYTTWE